MTAFRERLRQAKLARVLAVYASGSLVLERGEPVLLSRFQTTSADSSLVTVLTEAIRIDVSQTGHPPRQTRHRARKKTAHVDFAALCAVNLTSGQVVGWRMPTLPRYARQNRHGGSEHPRDVDFAALERPASAHRAVMTSTER